MGMCCMWTAVASWGGPGRCVVETSVGSGVDERFGAVQEVTVWGESSPVVAVAAATASVVDAVARTSRAAGAFACCFEKEG